LNELESPTVSSPITADNEGTAELPPAGCEYLGKTVANEYVISAALPPGTTI
jgi:hypothetical protein